MKQTELYENLIISVKFKWYLEKLHLSLELR